MLCGALFRSQRELSKSTIAIVRAGGVHLPDQEPFNIADELGGQFRADFVGITKHLAALTSQLREHLDAVTEIPADEITDEDLMRTRSGCSNPIQNSAAQWPSKTITFCSIIRRSSFPG